MLFLSKEEKIIILLYRIEKIRAITLLGLYGDYQTGEKKIKKLKDKIRKLGGDPDTKLTIN